MGGHPHAGDTMSEHPTADGTDLDAREAAETIDGLQSVDDALARRTAGVTWMIWGLVAPAIFVTYAAFGSALRGTSLSALQGLLWAPWALLGSVATWAAWETAGTARPELQGGTGRLVGGVLLFLVAIFVALGLGSAAGVAPGVGEDLVVLAGLGGGALVAGVVGFPAPEREARRLYLASGAFMVLVAGVGMFALAGLPRGTAAVAGAGLASVTSALALFLPGLVLTRGG